MSTTNQRTGINADFKPVVDRGLDDLKSMYDSGQLGQVAGVSDLQQMVFDAAPDAFDKGLEVMDYARNTYKDAMAGEGAFDSAYIEDMEQAAIDQVERERAIANDKIATSGVVGGSRQAIANNEMDAMLIGELAKTKYDQEILQRESAMWGADSMMNSGQGEAGLLGAYAELGGVQRDIEQEMLDAPAKGLENYLAGMQVFTPLMTEQTSTTTSLSNSSQKQGK